MAPLSCYGAQYEEMIGQLDQNATMDTPPSLQELHDAYSRLMGGHMRLKKLLAKMMASYLIHEIEAVWGALKPGRRQIHDGIYDLLFTDEGRESAIPPDRRVLYEFDAERRAKCAAADRRRNAQAIMRARNNQINNTAAAATNLSNTTASAPNNSNIAHSNTITAFIANHNYYTAPAAATPNNTYHTASNFTANPAVYYNNHNILSHSNTMSMILNAYYSPHGTILIVHYLTAFDADTAAQNVFLHNILKLPGHQTVALTHDECLTAWHNIVFRNIVGMGSAPWLLANLPPVMAYAVPF
jgi:hypothetical protein